ncbi:MAG: hypothetical protein IPM24_27420 [Bryobacterales bacterium]|nr:hypothetical protein [Bryobacterales bacterium]
MSKLFALVLLAAALGQGQDCASALPRPESGYGAPGPYGETVETFRTGRTLLYSVSIHFPDGKPGPYPVIFFAHGFSNNRASDYAGLISHLVSQGNAVVFAPYLTVLSTNRQRYDALWEGFREAVDRFGGAFDLSRVAFAGHSFGGGAVPALAYRGLVEEKWGANGAFLFIMAPWYVLETSYAEWASLPSDTRLIVQVYEEDQVTDHRIAAEIFETSPLREKQYVLLRSDSWQGCRQRAGHGIPSGDNDPVRLGGLERYGLFRLFDAVAGLTFRRNETARAIAFGNGSPEQRFMGRWPDGTPARELVAGTQPVAVPEQSATWRPNLAPPAVRPGNVRHASTYEPFASSGAIVSIFGWNLASETAEAEGPELPNTLAGVQVTLNGMTAPLYFVSPGQINAQIPFTIVSDQVTVIVRRGALFSEAVTLPLKTASPGVLVAADGTALALRPDGSLVTRENPARRGEPTTIFGIGLGPVFPLVGPGLPAPVDPLSRVRFLPRVLLGDTPAPVGFAGLAPGFVSLYQVNLDIPAAAPRGAAVPLTLRVGDAQALPVALPVD